jgi:hypothetical protein
MRRDAAGSCPKHQRPGGDTQISGRLATVQPPHKKSPPILKRSLTICMIGRNRLKALTDYEETMTYRFHEGTKTFSMRYEALH